jgi:hypothetical protein
MLRPPATGGADDLVAGAFEELGHAKLLKPSTATP